MRGLLYAMYQSLGKPVEASERFHHEVLAAMADFRSVPSKDWAPMLEKGRVDCPSAQKGFRPTNAEILAAWKPHRELSINQGILERQRRDRMIAEGRYLEEPRIDTMSETMREEFLSDLYRAAGLRRDG